jgi:tol-pal system protein YbgF
VAAVLLAGATAGCGALRGGARAEGGGSAADPAAALRPELDRLRTDVTELRALVEATRRSGAEHTDAGVREVRSEIEAVQRALEASARNDLQRQVEVLDAQAARIDLLEKRARDLAETLRRVEATVTGLEAQLEHVADALPPAARRASTRGAAGGGSAPAAPARPRAAGPTSGGAAPMPVPVPPPAGAPGPAGDAQAAPAGSSDPPAGAAQEPALVPPAMLNVARPARSAPAAPEGGGKPVAPEERPPRADAAAAARPAATASAPVATVTARMLFDRAMESWKKGEPGQAVLDLEDLVQSFPSDRLAASAQFWIGEAYYAARDYERATAEYRKAVELAPTGKDTPQALLRLGLAYRAQRREAEARQAWNRLVREFPSTDAAEEARRALRAR